MSVGGGADECGEEGLMSVGVVECRVGEADYWLQFLPNMSV